MRRSAGFVVVFAVFGGACGPKEALDPSEVLAEDPEFTTPGYGPPADPERSPPNRAPERPATRAECEAAARHLEALGLELAAAEAATDADRTELERQRRDLTSDPAIRERVDHAAAECVGRETSAREARCVARVRALEDIEGCTE